MLNEYLNSINSDCMQIGRIDAASIRIRITGDEMQQSASRDNLKRGREREITI